MIFDGFLLSLDSHFFAAIAGMLFSVTLCASIYLLYEAANSKRFGYLIDAERRTLEFWAIGTPSDIKDWLDKENWKRLVSRRKVKLVDVLRARASDTRTFDDDSQQWQYLYHLELQGTFGNLPFTFPTEAKRDEFYAQIVGCNEFGIPIV